jgi:YspA, cpYpsA-related SLOG family
MRLLICGGRDYSNRDLVYKTLDQLKPTEICHGAASGADSLAEEWAVLNKISSTKFYPDWKNLGRAAGPIRNKQMRDTFKPDKVLAFPGGKGTANMIALAKENKIEVIEIKDV